jgi:hypothetical protein
VASIVANSGTPRSKRWGSEHSAGCSTDCMGEIGIIGRVGLLLLRGNGFFGKFTPSRSGRAGEVTDNETLQAGDEEAIDGRLPNGDDPDR